MPKTKKITPENTSAKKSKVSKPKKAVGKKVKEKKVDEVVVKKESPISQVDTQHILNTFFQVIGDLRTSQESEEFLLDFLTDSERLTFAKRLAIALELKAGKSYETIRKEYGVSSATISTVAEMMKKTGMKLAIKKVGTDKWAQDVSTKFFNFFKIAE